MNQIVPPSLLFDFQLVVPRCGQPSKGKTGRLLKLPDEATLFSPSSVDGKKTFATLQAGWNEDGFGLQVSVSGKQKPLTGDSKDLNHSDCILLWLDTRHAGNVHRATEYCHHFACLPSDERLDGNAAITVEPIAQQRTQRLESDPRKMLCRTHATKTGYDFEVWIPGSQLYGYREISEIGRMGFFCVVQDTELGSQHLAVDDNFPYSYDPSVWLQLELLP
jgi:hypothetical protein